MRELRSLCLAVLLCSAVFAQLPTSTLNGTVNDPQGAAVSNAKVILTSLATRIVRETTSNAQGFSRTWRQEITRLTSRVRHSRRPR